MIFQNIARKFSDFYPIAHFKGAHVSNNCFVGSQAFIGTYKTDGVRNFF
jgi:hypothetical protein